MAYKLCNRVRLLTRAFSTNNQSNGSVNLERRADEIMRALESQSPVVPQSIQELSVNESTQIQQASQEERNAYIERKIKQMSHMDQQFRKLELMQNFKDQAELEFKQQYLQLGTNYFVSPKGNQEQNGLKLVHNIDYKRINDFVKGVKENDYLFYDDYLDVKEVVLLGSANVGKSSLINALNNGFEIAHTAKRSGKTQELNFYLAENKIYKKKRGLIVDTPGYGFVVAPIHLKEKWKKMVFKYLGFGVRINMIVLCVNGKFGLKANDLKMLEDLKYFKKPVQVVLTKIDQIRERTDIIRVVTDTTGQLQKYRKFVYPEVHLTSADHMFGIKEVRAKIGIAFEDICKHLIMTSNQAEIKKQVEFYLSDKNLSQDQFFHQKISGNVEHWLDIADILNCNKIKKMKISEADIATSLKSSSEVEVSADGKKVRRVGKKALPELLAKEQKKREVKAQAKEEEKNDGAEDVIQLDERGNHVLVNADFENPIIIHFKTEAKEEGFKVNWKDIETEVKKQNPLLKIVYSRADQYEGDLAISSHKLKQGNLEKLTSATLNVQNKAFTFAKTAGEELKDFWAKQGGHYQFCIQPKLRNIKKQQKIAKQQKRESGSGEGDASKRSKNSYEIAGVLYSDISKVKSKARAILTIKKDGEKLTGNDEEFIKEIIKFHDKSEAKMKDFDHFEAGEHPNYEKTRCFFVVRSNGQKEDFSISKCIMNLEKQSQ